MRHRVIFVALVLSVSGFVMGAAEKPPEDYQRAMKDLGAYSQGINKAVSDGDFDAIAKYAASALEAFGVAEKYWTGKSDAQAVKAAQTGGKLAGDLAAVASLKSKEGAAYSVKQIAEVCTGCHAAHREALPDSTFQIK